MDAKPATPPTAKRGGRRRLVSRLLILFVAIVLGVPGGFLFARIIHIPLVDSLHTYRPSVITRIYDRNGEVFDEYSIQRRIVIPKERMSPHLVQGIIATEDARFYEHGGIDLKAIARAAITDVIARRKVEGASTMTQQLAKQVFLTPEKSWKRKINEAFLAIEIEKNFTKDQIFELYANQMNLGHGAWGVESASRLYFGKQADELTLPEAATIAGMIRRPMYYSPINNPNNAVRRRNHVLRRMLEVGDIERAEFRQAVASPLVLGTYSAETPDVGAYFSEEIRQYIDEHPRLTLDDLYKRGIEVHTTLDIEIQKVAERVMRSGLRRLDRIRGFRKPARNLIDEQIDLAEYVNPEWSREVEAGEAYPAVVLEAGNRSIRVRLGGEQIEIPPSGWQWTRRASLRDHLRTGDLVHVRFETDQQGESKRWFLDQSPLIQGAMVVMDVRSGEVLAMVGGYDFNTSKFNRAIQSRRQTGSAFKPFVYGAAFENGFTPADTLFDEPVAIEFGGSSYAPRNYGGQYTGIVTIQRALELSINVPAVKTYMMVGGDKVTDFARRCGITAPLPPYPSVALGAAGVSPLELTAAFNAFANGGIWVRPRMVRRVTDATQKVLDENFPEFREATTAQNAYLLTHAMTGVIRRGTGYEAHVIPGPIAGKTGTTNGYTDAWFVGFTPELSVGIWVGYDDPSKSLGGGSTGGDIALPLWIDFFRQIDAQNLRGEPKSEFERPPGIVLAPMDLKTGRLGEGPCTRVVMQAFIAGTEPTRDCTGMVTTVASLPFYLQRPFYEPKESEPTTPADDATAQPGEGGEAVPPPPHEDEIPLDAPPDAPPDAPLDAPLDEAPEPLPLPPPGE
ncbi:MAG TPA: PBP1A family penicillin-binding protein [Thermoanaerobaculia bacterium]|nr:PBP1A family penicillin-binding protein [Thermoanaerobaculia bacterium]